VPGDSLTYEWDLDDDSIFETSGPTPTFDASSLDGPDTVTVTLRVSDGDGGVTTDTAIVAVRNVTPTIEAGGPYKAKTGEIITFTVSITDAVADSHTVEWDLDDNGTFETVGQTVTRTYALEGDYQVGVRVTDDDGAWATDVAQVAIGLHEVYLPVVLADYGSEAGSGVRHGSPDVATSRIRWAFE
jgi:hypothetical protein